MVAGNCGKGFMSTDRKHFSQLHQWRKLHLCRKYNKSGRPMEGVADVNEDFSDVSKKSQSSAFFLFSIVGYFNPTLY
jgi:hypothetical protein